MAGASLFVYGTLMSEPHLYSLTGRRFPRQRATLEGFERILPNQGYPYVVPKSGGQVEGFLLQDVDPASVATLDAYEDEGRLYVRRPVEVVVRGRRVPCETYVDCSRVTGQKCADLLGERRCAKVCFDDAECTSDTACEKSQGACLPRFGAWIGEGKQQVGKKSA